MLVLMVQIARFVDSHQPGWVECEFVDAEGRRHLIIEKVPVVTAEDLDADSEYPKSGTVRCEILKRYRDEKGQELVSITTARPISIESTEGASEFTVPANLIASLEN
jgi:hypothetical protein